MPAQLHCALLVLGFLFARWLLWSNFTGWGVTAFSTLFCGGVLWYARAKKVRQTAESRFWMAIMLLTALAFGLFPAGLLQGWQVFLLAVSAVYWCACLFGTLVLHKTSNLLPLDLCNTLVIIPARNRGVAFKSLPRRTGGKQHRKAALGRFWAVAAGLLVCAPLLGIVLPLLFLADTGGFMQLFVQIEVFFRGLSLPMWAAREFVLALMQLLLALPIAWYLGGLLFGSANHRNTDNIDLAGTAEITRQARFVPRATVIVVLGVVSVVYVLFIAYQLPYFFSAFAGVMPSNFAAYSTYAREGFFELCTIAAINLGLLGLAGCLCKTPARASRLLRAANIVLTGLTLLVLATAFSKMALYMMTPSAHGFTPKRIMTCVFMLFLAGVCVAVIVHQFRGFSLVRFASMFGAGLLCALCLCNLNGIVARYNATQYLNGHLKEFNPAIIERGGPAGYQAAVDVYNSLDDMASSAEERYARQKLADAIFYLQQQAQWPQGTSRDTLASALIRMQMQEPI